MSSPEDPRFPESEPQQPRGEAEWRASVPSGSASLGQERPLFTAGPAPAPPQPSSDYPGDHSSNRDTKKKRRLRQSLLFEVVVVCILALGLALLLRTFIAQAYEIRGDSMKPTLYDGQKVMISKLSPSLDSLDPGDIVIFSDPNDAQRDLIKRVIGLPGDLVVIDDNSVSVNGQQIDEQYILRAGHYRGVYHSETVPEGSIFVLGDNRANSKDSRDFGSIPITSVRGKVFLRLWPLDSFETFP